MVVDWPLAANTIRRGSLSNTFGMVRKHTDGTPKPHQGWDFSAHIGTDTFAIADGKIVFVTHNQGDYGTQVCMEFPFGETNLYAFYAHLKSVFVHKGQKVSKGQRIARTGDTGNAHGMPKADEHLHFEIRIHAILGQGLGGRLSPIKVFGICPLKGTQFKQTM